MTVEVFSYKARGTDGQTSTGVLKAESESDAVKELHQGGLTVISLDRDAGGKAAAPGGSSAPFSGLFSRSRAVPAHKARVKDAEMVVFTRQLATMVGSGIPLVDGLEILAEQIENPGFRSVIDAVCTEVRGGKDLSSALSMFPRIFPDIYVNMICAGEASGQLDTVLDRLAEYQEASSALKSDIKSAMTYPIVSLLMVLGITFFLLVFVIPKFEDMFSTLNVELPGITTALLSASLFLRENVLYWMGGVVALGAAAAYWLRSDSGITARDWMLINIPVFGPLFRKVTLSRFSRTLSTLIQSGVPILGALEIVSQTCGNRIFARAVEEASASVREGETLGEPLARSGVFPPMVTRMVSIGERTGALEALLEKIADFYDRQVKTSVEGLTSMIEPFMIGIMGFLVGGMVMAIFLPIFKMVGSMGG